MTIWGQRTMKRTPSAGHGDLELAAIDLEEEEKDIDEGMAAFGYGGAPEYLENKGVDVTLSPTTRALAACLYLGVNAFFFWLMRATDGVAIHDDVSSTRSVGALVAVAVAVVCYFVVQWSDPGYAAPPARFRDAPGAVDHDSRKAAAAAAVEAVEAARLGGGSFSTLLPWPEWPPMRVGYCRPARRWVYTYDHYCPFVGNAVGERNRARFWVYLAAQTAALGRCAAMAEAAVRWADVDAGHLRAPFLAVSLTLLFLVCAAFFVFHTFLLLTNMTTNEFLGAHRLDYLHNTEDFDLPFTRGLAGNVAVYFGQDGAFTALRRSEWLPTPWVRPAFIDRDSDDWWANPWQNKYWSCC